jgi:hypothetical protein
VVREIQDRGVVWVSEEEDHEFFLTGRFDAVLDRGASSETGPRDVGLDEALEWARHRSRRVVVVLGSTRYSAGQEPVDDHPALPILTEPLQRRRDPAFAYLDRLPSDAPVEWPVELDFHLDAEPLGSAAYAFVETIAHDKAVTALEAQPVATERTVRAAFRLSARTYGEVNLLADAILKQAMRAAIDAIPAESSSGWYAGHRVNAPDDRPSRPK